MFGLAEIPDTLENDQIWFHQVFAKSLLGDDATGEQKGRLMDLDHDCVMFQTSFAGTMGYPEMKGVDFLEAPPHPARRAAEGGMRVNRTSLQIRNQGSVGGCPKGAKPVILHFQGAGKWLRPRSEGAEAEKVYGGLKKAQKAKNPFELVGALGEMTG